jgi:DegV family protein with EDD domain
MTVALLTDSAASLPVSRARDLDVALVPLKIVIGGVDYSDAELGPEEVVAALTTTAPARVSTSSPSPGDFAKVLDEILSPDGAVVVTVSSTMSSTYESALVASRYFEEGAVQVVDSGTAAGGQGLVVLAAAEAAAAGADASTVAATARRAASRVHLLAAVENLDYLARSGRVPGIAARAGNSLGVRAVFEFAGGHAKARRPALGMKAALERVVDSIGQGPSGSLLRAAVLHAEAGDYACQLEEMIRSEHRRADIFVAPFSAVMVAHTGPGLIGAAWWWDDAALPRLR